jgi:hypothetical protein
VDIKRIRKVGNAVQRGKIKFTKEEVLAEWEKIKDASDEELTHAYAVKNYDWIFSACTQIAGKAGDWYGFLKAMGKSEVEIENIRKAGRESIGKKKGTKAGKTSDGKTIVIVDSENENNGNQNGIDYSKAISTIRSPDIVSTRAHSTKIVRFNLSLQERQASTKQQSKAEEIRRQIGSGADWNDPEFVKKYKETLPQMAPWVVHRACILYLLGLAKAGNIEMPKNILSAASGPSEVHESIADLKQLFEKQDIQMPKVYDLDLSMNMLIAGDNKAQGIADIRATCFRNNEFEMVENSSIFQFGPSDVKSTLIESNRIIKEGGYLLLVSNGKKFADSFYEGLDECGFELVSGKDEMFDLDKLGKRLLKKAHGKRFSQKFNAALGDSVFILARKVGDANQDVDENKFTFEGFDSAPSELREFLDEFKGFLRGVDKGDVESTIEHRRKAIARFKDIEVGKPEIFSEYISVFNRAQEKFWSVVQSPRYSAYESLEHLRARGKANDKVLPRVWKRLPAGRKKTDKIKNKI